MNPVFFSGLKLEKNKICLRLATAFALAGLAVLTAFPVLLAPQIAASAQDAAYEAQYRLPDGSLPYICFNGSGDPATDDQAAAHCPLCTLTQLADLPLEALGPALFLLERRGKPAFFAEIPVASHTAGSLGPRAPPEHA